ncbi:MAG: N-acetylmuramoyl-L-alanine amidase [Bacteroidaceae bacterium]|nr:N-acetylmuramoyl-L-alanine amidase [Bacteroidaceae bacterium]
MKRTTFLMVLFVMLLMGVTSVVMGQNKPFLVVLDAGHGGHDAGAVGRPTTNREKDINLAIALKVGKLLQQNCPDVQVLYTRSTDVFVTLSGRADIANKAKADLFVSIHTNAIERSASRRPMGVQSYTLTLRTAQTNLEVEKRENSVIQFEADGAQKYSFMNPNSPESEIMFELMQDRDMQESVNFAKLAQEEMVKTGGRKDMGVLQANLAVLRLTYMPSVLIEVGFISTPEEELFLMSDEGRSVMAKCIYNAISRYKTQHTGRMSNLEKIDTKAVQQQIEENNAQLKEAIEQAESANETEEPQPEVVQTPQTNPVVVLPVSTPTETTQTTSTSNAKPVFKVQFLSSPKHLVPGSTQFKGVQGEAYKEGNVYKYMYGSTTDYNEATKLKNTIADRFPDAFVVAFKDGQKVNVADAINEWKNNK